MEMEVVTFAQVAAVFAATVLTIFGGIVISIRLIRRPPRQQAPQMSAVTDERIARIEQAVDAIAIEVERIAEGQRFTTKLLAERDPAKLPAPHAGRVITPH